MIVGRMKYTDDAREAAETQEICTSTVFNFHSSVEVLLSPAACFLTTRVYCVPPVFNKVHSSAFFKSTR